MRIHADDFGICKQQAEAILELNSSWNSKGTLNSISIFANSPCFIESCKLLCRETKLLFLFISIL